MTRQSISLTDPNNDWLESQVERQEFSSKSEAVNALIRQARKADEERALIVEKLRQAEQSVAANGHIEMSAEDMLSDLKAKARASGRL